MRSESKNRKQGGRESCQPLIRCSETVTGRRSDEEEEGCSKYVSDTLAASEWETQNVLHAGNTMQRYLC